MKLGYVSSVFLEDNEEAKREADSLLRYVKRHSFDVLCFKGMGLPVHFRQWQNEMESQIKIMDKPQFCLIEENVIDLQENRLVVNDLIIPELEHTIIEIDASQQINKYIPIYFNLFSAAFHRKAETRSVAEELLEIMIEIRASNKKILN